MGKNVIEVIFQGKDAISGAAGKVISSIKGIATAAFSLKGLVIGAGLTAGFTTVTNAARDFEKEMANVSTLVDTSEVDMQSLEKGVLALSTTVDQMPVDVVAGLYQTISAGAEPGKEAFEILEASAKLATAGLTETNTAVDVITNTINAYGLESSQATNISDIFFKTVEQGKTTVGALASKLGNAIPAAASLGVSIEELSAGVATLTKGGTSTDEVITSLNATMLGLVAHNKDFKKVGVDMMQVVSEKGLLGAMDALKEITGGNIEKMQEFVPSSLALKTTLALTGKQYEEFNTILKKVKNSTGATEIAFKKQTATLDSAFGSLSIAFNKAMILVGTLWKPALIEALTTITSFLNQFTTIFSHIPEIISMVTDAGRTILIRFFTDFSYFKAFLNNLATFAGNVIDAWSSIGVEMLKVIAKINLVIWTPILTSFQAMGSQIRAAWQAMVNEIKEIAIKSAITIVEKLNTILPKAFEFDTSGLKNTLFEIQTEAIKPATTMEEAWKLSGETMGVIFADIGTNFSQIGNFAGIAADDIKTSLTQAMTVDEIATLRSDLTELFNDSTEEAENFNATMGDTEKVIKDASEAIEELGSTNEVVTTSQKERWKELQVVVTDFNKTKVDLANEALKADLQTALVFKASEAEKAAIAISGAQAIVAAQKEIHVVGNQVAQGTIAQRQAWAELTMAVQTASQNNVVAMQAELEANLNLALAVGASESEKAALIIASTQTILEAKRTAKDEEIAIEQEKSDAIKAIKVQEADDMLENATSLEEAFEALSAKEALMKKNNWVETAKVFKSINTQIVGGFSRGIANMIMNGGNLRDSLRGIFASIAQSAIAKIIEMTVMNILGSAAQGAASMMAWFAALGPFGIAGGVAAAAAIFAAIKAFTPFADGGVVTRPTMGLVGEAGPEAIIPLDKFQDVVKPMVAPAFDVPRADEATTGETRIIVNQTINIDSLEVLPGITTAEGILDIPRDILEKWVRDEVLPVFENLARTGEMIEVV